MGMDIYIHCDLPKELKDEFYAIKCRLMKTVCHDGPIVLAVYFLLMFSPFIIYLSLLSSEEISIGFLD